MNHETVVYLDEQKESTMWLQLGPFRINLTYVERYFPIKDEEGTKIELRYASGHVQKIPVPEEESDRLLADLDERTTPEAAESELVVRWGAAIEQQQEEEA